MTFTRACWLALTVAFPVTAQVTPPLPVTSLPTEAPAKLKPTNDGFDYVRRDVMIPMRDGVKLHTVIARRSCSRARRTTPPS